MTEPDRARMFRDAPFDISLATDDNPFYFVERARPGQRAGVGGFWAQPAGSSDCAHRAVLLSRSCLAEARDG
jgi:hypothetical protein